MTTNTKHLQPHVDDYHSSDSEATGGAALDNGIPRKPSPSAQANVSTKRSKELKSENAKEKNMDLRSDSGYSSYTAASKSSADSAPSTSRHPPAAPTTTNTTAPAAPASPAPKARKSAGGGGERQLSNSNENSPRQRPSRTASVSSKQRPATGTRRPTLTQETEECRDANWLTIGPNAQPPRRLRPDMPPSQSSHNVRHLNIPSDTASHRSAPEPLSPPSPTYARQPAPYGSQGPAAAIVQPARTRRPSVTTRPRPQSFAGEPGAPYWVPSMPVPGYPSPPHEQQQRGPPPAFFNPHMQQHMQYPLASPTPYMQQQMPPGGYYPPQFQASPPYEQPQPQQRPPLSARASSQRQAPLVTQARDDQSNLPSARYGPAPPAPERQQQKLTYRPAPKPKLIHDSRYEEDQDTEEESSEEDEYDDYETQEEERRTRADRALMPPPILRRNPSQRPPLSHAKTAPAVERLERQSRRKSIVVPDPLPAREDRSARRQSMSRPSHRQTQSEYTTAQARVEVNRTGSNRRQSYQAYERAQVEFARARQAEAHERQVREREDRKAEALERQAREDRKAEALERQVREERKAEALERRIRKEREAEALERQLRDERRAEAAERQYRDERKREMRASKVVVNQNNPRPRSRHVPGQFDDDEDEEDEEDYEERAPQVLRARNTRRKTDAGEERTRKERAPEPKNKHALDHAEEYIMSTRGSRTPFADSVNKAAKRQSMYDDGFSESTSSHSGGASQSNRTTMTSNTANELRLRIDNSQAINIQLTGDTEGRTLQLLPAENGMTDLVIGNNNARGEGSMYHSQKGSIKGIAGNRRSMIEGPNVNRRSMIEGPRRREVDDFSERSSRAGRNRRDRDEILEDHDEPGHALRRARTTRTTHYN